MGKAVVGVVLIAFAVVGFVVFGGGDPERSSAHVDPSEVVATISHGEAVDIEKHLRFDVWTVVEFTADW